MPYTFAPQPSSINPYDSQLALDYTGGIAGIAGSMASSSTLKLLNDGVVSYLETTYYGGTPTPDQTEQLEALQGNLFNAYIGPDNPYGSAFNERQLCFIRDIISGLDDLTVNQYSATNFFQVIEDGLAMSGLTTIEQAPILMAESITKAAYFYFYQIISAASIPSPWSNWMETSNLAVNYMNLSRWMKAIFRGALIGWTQSIAVVPTDAPQGTGISFNLISMVGGALTTTFGEIAFFWVQRPAKACSCYSPLNNWKQILQIQSTKFVEEWKEGNSLLNRN